MFKNSPKIIHLVNLLLLLGIIVVSAKLTSHILTHHLSRLAPKIISKTDASQPTGAVEDLVSFSLILERGLFGPASQGKLMPIAVSKDSGVSSSSVQRDLILLGTAQGSFRETFALIQKAGTKEERVFRLNEKVFDLGRLTAVRKEWVEIETGGSKVKLFAPTAVSSEAGKPLIPGTPSGNLVSQIGAGTYVVDQRALHSALENIDQAMTAARLLPNMKDGKVEGFRVTELRPSGLFGLIGLRNGDVLVKINDFPIDSPEKALQSFISLKGLSRVKLDLLRDGQPSTFVYDIR